MSNDRPHLSGSKRLIRVPVPAALLKSVDELVESGEGGYEDRAEFVVDAIRERLLEVEYAGVAVGSTPQRVAETQEEEAPNRVDAGLSAELGETAVSGVVPDYLLELREDTPQSGPLFGFHNRDFPSIWALAVLAQTATAAPVPVAEFMSVVAAEAWGFGRILVELERQGVRGLTGLFPTNPDKPETSERGFLNFAIGECRQSSSGWATRGPLFQWGVAGIIGREGIPHVAVTPVGSGLLDQMFGLTAEAPHAPEAALGFVRFLKESAADDWWGFKRLLTAVKNGASTREEVIRHFHESPFNWTQNEVSTNAAGYVARAREWGILEPKQQGGRYVLTGFGREQVEQGGSVESVTAPRDASTISEESR